MRDHFHTVLAGVCLLAWLALGMFLGVPMALNEGVRTTPLAALSLAAGAVSVVLFVILGTSRIVNFYRTRSLIRSMTPDDRARLEQTISECAERGRVRAERDLAEW
jgi:hypothetical protein